MRGNKKPNSYAQTLISISVKLLLTEQFDPNHKASDWYLEVARFKISTRISLVCSGAPEIYRYYDSN
jgi:hypothetical protein